jgi:hypothetical protein
MDEEAVVKLINDLYGEYYTALKASPALKYGKNYYSVLIRKNDREIETIFMVTEDDALPIPG